MRFKKPRTGADRPSSPPVTPLRFAALPRPPPHLVDALAAQVLPALAPVSPQDTMKWLRLLLVALGRRVGVSGCSVAAVAAATPEALLDACARVLALLGPDPEEVRAAFAAEWEVLSRRAEAGPPGDVSFSAPSESSVPRSGSAREASPALEALVERLEEERRPVVVQVGPVRYAWPPSAREAANLRAASLAVSSALSALASSPPRPLPPTTLASVILMPPPAAALWLAEEAACSPAAFGLGNTWRVPRETLQLLRLCRCLPPTADLATWLAAVRGVPVACGPFVVGAGDAARNSSGGSRNNNNKNEDNKNNSGNDRPQSGRGGNNNNNNNMQKNRTGAGEGKN